MEARQVCRLSFMSTWMLVFFLLAGCSGTDSPKICLDSTVFVAFAGETLRLPCELKVPANQSGDALTCFNSLKQPVYSCDIANSQPQTHRLKLELSNVTLSGEYFCRYKNAHVYFYLLVQSKEELNIDLDRNYTEVGVVGVFTAVLLVFSVVGSVYVFRGHWSDCFTECGKRGTEQKQKREERNEGEQVEDNVDVMTAPSTSFYASLEPRPRSIYDVLDHSAVRDESDTSKAEPKKRKPKKTVSDDFRRFVIQWKSTFNMELVTCVLLPPQAPQPATQPDQQEGEFECVYENF
uniref:uncharacterized protein LOC120825195 isoform X1 n=1 Tax=Gasterosteus aculeatus aculeatus TaxID=481459 RepID=UPI001A99F745|nr:uncharacterized protein LOC120825195 isoform X1 [Gasterosteus aculeatus aculeatus]